MTDSLLIQMDPEIRKKLLVAILQFQNLINQKLNTQLWKLIEQQAESLKSRFKNPGDALKHLKPARDLYRAIGIEPTRTRPSSEALFRRVVKNKDLYQISSIVDVCNHISLHFFLPIGLYDIAEIRGGIKIRLGRPGEEYQGIGKEMVHVGNRLVLSDDVGPFGNPSSDSYRTRIKLKSQKVLMTIFAPFDYPPDRLHIHMEYAQEVMMKFHPGANVTQFKVLSDH
jgi:DNA/RNA-binding domain of Phe-tRNA-synthetase-like protein